jgi:hypothetical protein
MGYMGRQLKIKRDTVWDTGGEKLRCKAQRYGIQWEANEPSESTGKLKKTYGGYKQTKLHRDSR